MIPTVEDEFEAQRKHDQMMARLNAEERQEKRLFRGKVLIGLALLLALFGIIGAIVIGVIHSNNNKIRIEQEHSKVEQQHADVAKYCMDKGYIWINNSCIPKEQTQK